MERDENGKITRFCGKEVPEDWCGHYWPWSEYTEYVEELYNACDELLKAIIESAEELRKDDKNA